MTDREHEVFISYSSKNKNIADAIVADLEQNGIKCWYAPRDILVGDDWAGAIKNAIETTKVFVLVFTDESNKSHQVTNEVTLAVNSGKIIIPFKMSSSDMNDTLVYYLSSVHWLDAVSKPLSANIETLRKQICALLDINEGAAAAAAGVKTAQAGGTGAMRSSSAGGNISGSSGGSSGKTGIVIGIIAAVLAVCIGVFALSGGKKDSSAGTENADVQAAADSDEQEPAQATETASNDAQAEVAEKPVEEPAEAVQEPQEPTTEAAEETKEAEAEEPAGQEAEAEEPANEEAEEEKATAVDTTVMIPDNALSYNGHHYYIYNDIKTNWDEAASNCRDRGGYLAVINDADENEKIFKYMTAMGYDQAFFGLTYSHGKDDWVYLDGDSSDYRDWGCNSKGEAEPNNASGNEYHVQFDVNMQDGHWNDAKFGAKVYTPEGASYKNRYTYICEWDQ